MKNIKLKTRVSVKKLLDGFNFSNDLWDAKHWNTGNWHQLNEPSEDVRNICSKILGINLTYDNSDIILHIGNEDVPNHSDGWSKSVYLIPLRFSKSMYFYCDDSKYYGEYSKKYFKKGFGIQFNDHHDHGISNDYNGKFLIISVSKR